MMEIIQGEKSLESSLKSVNEIRFGGRRMIPDRQIWESHTEDSRKVFWHFGVREIWRLSERRIAKCDSTSVVDRERSTWQWIKEFKNRKSEDSWMGVLEFREDVKPEP
jgi:hypothetical protein